MNNLLNLSKYYKKSRRELQCFEESLSTSSSTCNILSTSSSTPINCEEGLRDVENSHSSYNLSEEEPPFVALQYDSSSEFESEVLPLVAEPHLEQIHDKILKSSKKIPEVLAQNTISHIPL